MMFLFDRFMLQNKAKGLAQETLDNYETTAKDFERWCETNSIVIPNITKEDINNYAIHLSQRVNSVTVNTMIARVRRYLYWLMEEGELYPFTIELPKKESVIKEVYTESELTLLLEKPNLKEVTFCEYRTWVMINYIVGTGNRLKSVLNIRIKDVDLDASVVVLRKTKNKRQQIVPLTPSLVLIIDEYLKYRRGSDDDYLFCDSYGKGTMSRKSVSQEVNKYNRKRGVNKTGIHKFRHTFATMYMRNGGDIYRLSKLLGHSSVLTTEEYIHCLPIDLIKDYNEINPLEKIVKNKRKKIKLR